MSRWLSPLLAFALTAIAVYGAWWLHGRPHPLPDVDHPKLGCVSYAPYREGQSPYQQGLVIPPEQIEEDFQMLSKSFDCVRTYSTSQGLDQVPRIAKKYGLQVLLGAWIGRETTQVGANAREIETVIRLANDPANAGVIRAIIVGNEVLLRREFNETQMAAWIAQVRGKVPVPVTYADVWEFWLKYPSMADAVDYITVHILPFWEDDPVSVEKSIAHLRDVLGKMRSRFPDKTLFIGETGWPSAGRMREGAAPGPVNQARYIREFVLAVESENIGYNVIEAFDQPWKRVQEGTVGGEWGIFDVHRHQKFPFSGPVSENPDWRWEAAGALAIAAALLLSLLARGHRFGFLGWLAAAAAAQIAGASLIRGWVFVVEVSINWSAWTVGLATLALAAASAFLLFATVADLAAGREAGRTRPASVARATAWLRRPWSAALDRAMALGVLQTLTVFGAACHVLQLLFDPRYRDFPLALYLVPAGGFALLIWLQRRAGTSKLEDAEAEGRYEERWLAALAAIAAIISAMREGPLNYEALSWAVIALMAFAPWLKLAWAGRKSRQPASAAYQPQEAE